MHARFLHSSDWQLASPDIFSAQTPKHAGLPPALTQFVISVKLPFKKAVKSNTTGKAGGLRG